MEHPGYMLLRDQEVEGLRKYLLAGGVLAVIDFWNTREWEGFAAQIRRVGRASQGVRTMRVEMGAKVVALAPVVMQAQAEEAAPAEEAEEEVTEDRTIRIRLRGA